VGMVNATMVGHNCQSAGVAFCWWWPKVLVYIGLPTKSHGGPFCRRFHQSGIPDVFVGVFGGNVGRGG